MLLKSKRLLAVMALMLGFAVVGCDEKPPVEEPVKTDTSADANKNNQPIEPIAPVQTFAAETVYFAFDDYTLNSDAQGRLNNLANHLKTAQTTVVQIEGHCDERGSIEYNLALGERRAQSVKNYLSQLGVEAGRLSTISYGEEKPATDGHTESAWAKNRRAEFTLSTNK